METAKITFYKLEKCGLYKYGEEEPVFGKSADYLQQLKDWATHNSKPLEETCTYALEESEDVDNTYCYDIVKDKKSGDYLLTTWNETPSYEGKVAAVKRKSSVGKATVEFTKLPKDSIPGYATYFWFIPQKNVVATIRFQHRMNGKANLDKYMREFITKFSDYVVLGKSKTADFHICGYSADGLTNPQNLHGYFKANLVRKPGEIDYLTQNIGSIRKITRHNKLVPKNSSNQDFWQKALTNIGIKKTKKLTTEVKFSYEFSFKPKMSELKEIITDWQTNHDAKWDDVGFTLVGEQVPRWLSNSIAKDEFELDIVRVNDEIVDADSILDELLKQRNIILNLLD
ncbi:hypothetical protein [Vibrio atlanticus]|uniref:hypothetical protein n=1 Tax=Vibrio atlanticus TaxID=693153 RepID=UPI003D146139